MLKGDSRFVFRWQSPSRGVMGTDLARTLAPATLGLCSIMMLGSCERAGGPTSREAEEQVPESVRAAAMRPQRIELPSLADKSSLPVAAIYVEDWSKRGPLWPQVIVAFWTDGSVVWSADPIAGGPPYFKGVIQYERLRARLEELDRRGLFQEWCLRLPRYGLCATYTAIVVCDRQRRLEAVSWHELFEQNPNLVATADGIGTLEGQDRAEVLARQPEYYRRFRKLWDELRSALTSLIPAGGRPAGDLRFELRRAPPTGGENGPPTIR